MSSLLSSSAKLDEDLKGDVDFDFFSAEDGDNESKLQRSRSPSPSTRRSRSRSSSRSSHSRSSGSPLRSTVSPHRSSGSPRRSSGSPRHSSGSPRRSSGSPRRSSGSPRRSSGSPRHQRSSGSLRRRSDSWSSRSPSSLPSPPAECQDFTPVVREDYSASSNSTDSPRDRKLTSPRRARSASPQAFSSSPVAIISRRDSSSDSSSSESTVTDVSPLSSRGSSPDRGVAEDALKNRRVTEPKHIPGMHKNRMVSKPQTTDEDSLNVEIIMKALLELDKDRQKHRMSKPEKSRARDIDSENQRLLQNLLQTKSRQRNTIPCDPPVKRPFHSTINRQRQQRRIEEENKAIVKRLLKIKPTPGMTRNEQLSQYQRQATYGVPLYKAEGGKQRRPNITPSPYSGMGSTTSLRRTASASSLRGCGAGDDGSDAAKSEKKPGFATEINGRRRARPMSASYGRRTGPGQPRSVQPGLASSRPEWPSGW